MKRGTSACYALCVAQNNDAAKNDMPSGDHTTVSLSHPRFSLPSHLPSLPPPGIPEGYSYGYVLVSDQWPQVTQMVSNTFWHGKRFVMDTPTTGREGGREGRKGGREEGGEV